MTTDEKLDLLCESIQSMNKNMIEMRADIVELKNDMAGVKADIVELKNDMAGVKSDIARLKTDMTGVKAEIKEMKSYMDQRFKKMDGDIHLLQDNVREIRLTIENDIKPHINMIAEGHAILNRKLNEAIESASSIEFTKVRVSVLEEEVKRIKEAVSL